MVVFLNSGCNYGTGRRRWLRVSGELAARFRFTVVETATVADLRAAVAAAIRAGEATLVAAGGDGSVNALLNAVLAATDRTDVCIGAVGLGSSNDFHKPFDPGSFVAGVPVRVGPQSEPRDVIRVEASSGGSPVVQHCLLNASIGVTAEANRYFNARHRAIELLQRASVDVAITAAALRTIVAFRNIRVRLRIDGGPDDEVTVTNLGIIRAPHFAGWFSYDTPVADGRLGVNLCGGLSRTGMLAMLAALQKGRFRGRGRTRAWSATEVRVSADREFALEMDGEVVAATEAVFRLIPARVRCCR